MILNFKDVLYSKGQKTSNFTFDARPQQWLVQFKFEVCIFHTATVSHRRMYHVYSTSLITWPFL